MTTDRAGPEGTIEGIAVDHGRKGGDSSAVVLYWLGPDGTIYVLDVISPLTPCRLQTLRATCGQPVETG